MRAFHPDRATRMLTPCGSEMEGKFSFDVDFVFVRQVIRDIAFLVDLAALDERSLASMASHGRVQCLAAVENVQTRRREVQAALN
jgi:hypothetical protein